MPHDTQTWSVGLLNYFRIERDGEAVAEFYDRKQDLVLAYLALHRDKPTPRLALAKALWPDRPDHLVRNRLSESLHHLRNILRECGAPPDFTHGNRHVVQLHASVQTDVERFQYSVARALNVRDTDLQIQLLEEALVSYGDGLLPDINEHWVVDQRRRLASVHERELLQLAELLQRSGAFESMAEFAHGMKREELAAQWLRGKRLEGSTETAVIDIPVSTYDVSIGTSVPGRSLDELTKRHAERCIAIVEQAEPHLRAADRADWMALLDGESANIYVSLNWALDNGDRETALSLAAPLWPYWHARGQVDKGRDFLERALAVGSSTRSRAEAKAAHGAGALAMMSGEVDAARAHLDRALGLWRELDEPEMLARCVGNLSIIAYRSGHYDRARDYAAQAIAIFRREDRPDLLVRMLKDAGLIEVADGELNAAEGFFQEQLVLSRERHDMADAGRAIGNLATVAQERHRYEDARSFAEEALSIATEEDDLEGVAFSLRSLGNTSRLVGEYAVARAELEESISISRAMGDEWAVGESLQYLAQLEAATGNDAKARDLLLRSLHKLRDAGDEAGVSDVQKAISQIGELGQ